MALMIGVRGIRHIIEKASWWPVPPVLVASEKSGNTSDGDTQLRWSPPGIAGEPVVPTPAMMRTHGTGWTRRRLGSAACLSKWKDLNVLPTPVGHPGATKRSPCHIHPPHRSEKDRLALNRHRCRWGKRRRTALTRRARSPLAPDARHCSRRAQG